MKRKIFPLTLPSPAKGEGTILIMEIRRVQRAVLINVLLSTFFLAIGVAAMGICCSVLFFLSGWAVLLFLTPLTIFFVWDWFKEVRVKAVAYKLERIFPELKGRVVAALELLRYQGGVEGYSMELRDAAVAQVEELLRNRPKKSLVSKWRIFLCGMYAVGWLGSLFLFIALGGERFAVGWKNGFTPSRLEVKFQVAPGDTMVMAGDVVTFSVHVQPEGVFERVRMEIREDNGAQRSIVLSGNWVDFAVREGMSYRFRVLGKSSDWFRVGLIAPLTLRRMVLRCQPPAYARLPESEVRGEELIVLKGTRVVLDGEVSQAVERGRLVFPAETTAVTVDRKTPTRIRAEFVAQGEGEIGIELVPVQGEAVQKVGRIQLRLQPDEAPFVKVFRPGRDIDLPMSMQVLLGINSIDDYGLTDLTLHYGKDSISEVVRLKRFSGEREDTTLYVWDLSSSGLLPGEVLRYYVEVRDNDLISGPKRTKSDEFSIRFPTMTEIYSAAVEKTRTTQEELTPLEAKQEELNSQLTRIGEELKRSRELSWEEKKRLEGLLEEQKQLLGQVEALKQEIARTIDEMVQGMSYDPETRERLEQLQELLSRVLPKELQKALGELAQKLGERAPDVRQVLERVQLEQERFKENIERALELLKRIMEEERLEALARQAKELQKAQENVSRELRKGGSEELTQKQARTNELFDSLRTELNKLAAELPEAAIADSLNALNEKIAQNGLEQLAQELQSQLGRGEQQMALQKSEKLERGFKELAENLERLSEGLKRRRSEEVRRKLISASDALLKVSQAQEGLENRLAEKANPAHLAPEEMGLLEATRLVAESLAALGAQTLIVSPEMAQQLARVINHMKSAAEMLSTGAAGTGKGQMTQARMSLNRAISMVLDAAAQAAPGGGMKGGLQSLLEQLSQMTAEQMAINAGMSGIPIPIPVSGLSAGQMEQLQRLLAQQAALREQLERLLQSMGGQRPGLTGRLDQLVEEMKAVERALSELQIDRKLIERQEGILSRMLDAERSLRQQGFKEERQAETGKEYQIEVVPELPEDFGERNKVLREELLRALKQGYPREYERLIRSYFERLLEER